MTLDREAQTVLTLTVTASDLQYTTVKDITLILLDANDNRPIFEQSTYDADVLENAPVGTSLLKVHATDDDTGVASLVKYNIDEVIPSDGFSLFSIMESTGEVKLNGRLNFTSLDTFYRLKINASDGGGEYMGETLNQSSIAFAFITVLDVPDLDPQFISLPYTARVQEGSRLDLSVFEVTAIDQDRGINDDMIYSIENSTADGLFNISQKDGVISVNSEIDREVIGDSVTLIVKATEANLNIHGAEASTTADVEITIIDINDNKPEFYMCADMEECVKQSNFVGETFENSLGSIVINMTVKDLDKSARIKLTLEGADKEVFSVDPPSAISESPVRLVVIKSQQLDFEEKEQMVVQVIATDEDTSFCSTATVTINIKDTNDNNPKFPEDSYKLRLPEHSPDDTIVAKISAEDPDTMDQGKITYSLLPESIRSYFDVEPNSGTIYVKNSTLIDWEVRSLYSATLQAKDTSSNPGTAVLEIILTDINDKTPVFNRDPYLDFVDEGENLELSIQATDADDPETENSQIVYGIVPSRYSDNFTIDPNTGVLRNNGELNCEALDPELMGRIELNVTATDKGTPALSSMVKVIIDVKDINDNTPVFKAASYKFSVKEGVRGAYVGSVHAEDLDQTAGFNRISFTIIDGSIGSFMIRTFAEERGYRGSITVDPDVELDYESAHKNFTLRVEAADLGQKKAVVTVEVEVLDVNDERPEFKPAEALTVNENTTIAGFVGNFTALDRDGNHSLVYVLESTTCRCKGTEEPCDWFLLEPTGEIIVNPENTVDYELCDQVIMKAQVEDKYTEKGENNSVTSGEMVINIEDINDNVPEFIPSNSVFVVVPETVSKDTSVAAVTATDRDSGINKEITFEVKEVRFLHNDNRTTPERKVFGVVTTQQRELYVGLIQTIEELSDKLKGKYLVTVSATDKGGLSASTVVEIFTVDESFKMELRFASPVSEVIAKRDEIETALTAATNAAVDIVAIRSVSAESRELSDTIMEVYFIYSNGTAVTYDAVEKMLSDPAHFLILSQFGLSFIGAITVEDPKQNPIIYGLLGMVAGLIIVLAVLTTSLLCTRRTYRTKLKAAKAMNSAATVASENQKSGPVVPGTNKYTMEGANPVLNLNIDTATDEENMNADRISLNSLDYNVDMTMSDKDTRPMMMIQEEDEDNGAPEYIEPLGAALAQRGKKKGPDNTHLAFDNPTLSTTDL
ncbi:cadherin-related family member 2 [Centroberyx gerrardi]